MKQRINYSPKTEIYDHQFALNSTTKTKKLLLAHFINRDKSKVYASPSQQTSIYSKQPYNSQKNSNEVLNLRLASNYKKAQQGQKAQIQQKYSQKRKLVDLLRQTLNHQSCKSITQKYEKKLNTSNQSNPSKNGILTTFKNFRSKNPTKMTESTPSTLPESYPDVSLNSESDKKINENKNVVEIIKKQQTSQITQNKEYLKNVVRMSPSYIKLDEQKQTQLSLMKTYQDSKLIYPKLIKSQSARLYSPDQKEQRKERQNPEIVPYLIQSSSKKLLLPIYANQKKSILDQFQIGKKLGEGKFGIVNIARHKKTLSVLALKKIPKSVIKSHMMVNQIALQIRIQSCLSHKNILGMYGFFEDKKHLYIALEYMDGGNLYCKLKKGKMSQKQTALIIKNITQAVEYLHRLGIAHRDIKPENVVFSNVRIFGFRMFTSYVISVGLQFVIKGERHTAGLSTMWLHRSYKVKITIWLWIYGAWESMTFELLTGKAPFYHISRKQTMKKILNVENQNIVYPESMSQDARDFIDKLVRKNPQQRMKASEALKHPFILNAYFD